MVEKKLKPSMRENKRYLVVDANKEKVDEAVLKFLGVLGYAKGGIVFTGGNANIVAVNREELDRVRAAFALANIKVKKVSGTIKGLKK
jgi:RNase P/RNase MRP subunit POP5